jgi:Tol biopolymer transport system component
VSVVPPPPPPSTDVYLVSLDVDPLAWGLGQPINVTDRDGYDNQPRFLPDSSALLYTSIRNGQADIYRYDLGTRSNRQLTKTPESEYSPTPMPSGDGFSTVRVEADGTQRLWSFDHSGGNPVLLLEETAPVGYHGWLDAHRLGLFVLGSPPTLEVADLGAQTSVVRTNSIGRSIHLTPDGDSMSFVSKPPGGTWTIDVLEIEGTNRRTLMPTPEGSEDFTWAPDGWLVSSQGSRLLVARPGAEEPWQEVANLEGAGVRDITRLDISDDFRWMALVGNRTTAPPARTGRSFVLERVP